MIFHHSSNSNKWEKMIMWRMCEFIVFIFQQISYLFNSFLSLEFENSILYRFFEIGQFFDSLCSFFVLFGILHLLKKEAQIMGQRSSADNKIIFVLKFGQNFAQFNVICHIIICLQRNWHDGQNSRRIQKFQHSPNAVIKSPVFVYFCGKVGLFQLIIYSFAELRVPSGVFVLVVEDFAEAVIMDCFQLLLAGDGETVAFVVSRHGYYSLYLVCAELLSQRGQGFCEITFLKCHWWAAVTYERKRYAAFVLVLFHCLN